MKVSIVIPALNEEENIEKTIKSIPLEKLRGMGLGVETIVIDNASEDRTAEIAGSCGAQVFHEPRKGYGNAYLRGFKESSGDILVMCDADGTYPIETIADFIKPILQGDADLVTGSRMRGNIHKGAMPRLHRYVGNPLLTYILNKIYKTSVSDAHCGMRAVARPALEKLHLKSEGMEFASEMLIEASMKSLRIVEVPLEYRKRSGKTKLNSLRDGWRHLKFILLYKPTFIFMAPGILFFITGLFLLLILSERFHSMILGSFLMILGFQIIVLGTHSKIFAVTHRMLKPDRITRGILLRKRTWDYGIASGIALLLIGTFIGVEILIAWASSGYGALSELKNALISITLAITGIQMIFSCVFVSVLLLDYKGDC